MQIFFVCSKMSTKLKRARTVVIGSKDLERLEEVRDIRVDSNEPRDVQESNVSLKAAKELYSVLGVELEELQEEREKLLKRIGELEETVSQLNNTVDINMAELRLVKDQNDVLRLSLRETEQEAKVLRFDLETKTRDLKLMEDHAENCIIETNLMKRSRTTTEVQLKKNREENSRLKLEVDASRRISSMEREESQHLANDLVEAEKQIKFLTKQLRDAQEAVEGLQKDNIRLEEEINLAQSTLETKIIELNDTKQEVEFLRRPKFDTKRNSNVFEIQCMERVSKADNRSLSRGSSYVGDIGAFQSRRSDFQQNMFYMLQSLRGASQIFSANQLSEQKEPEIIEEDLQDDFFSRGTHRESTKWDGQIMHSVDEHVERSMSDEKEPSKMDILEVYAHLTAAAVKTNYPDIDFPKGELIRLGNNMPFWELHPYYTHIFESMKEKNKTKRNSTTSRTKRWLRWKRKPEKADALEVVKKKLDSA